MKNTKIDKKKVGSLLLAAGLMITSSLSSADITSYAGVNTTLTDGRPITLYYSNESNKSLINLNGEIGFIDNEYIKDMYFDTNDYFSELNDDDYIKVNYTNVYNDPIKKEVIGNLEYGTRVHLYAKTVDGYYVVYANNMMGFVEEACLIENDYEEHISQVTTSNLVNITKITGNNINVRSSPNKGDNIIGFCDITDKFAILDHVDGYYKVDYLGNTGYISDKYVIEDSMDRNILEASSMVYFPKISALYDDDGSIICYLPKYQNLLVIGGVNNYYKVLVDGVVGYVKKNETKELTKTTIVVDLSRQILKVFKNGKEVFRCKVITGAKTDQTRLGCFKIGHHTTNYVFKASGIFNEFWIQFDGNIGIHPADANNGEGWQKKEYFDKAVADAYDAWSKGYGRTYPNRHGSHGCVNTMIKDTTVIYSLCDIGDNVLVIEQNDLVKNKLISSNMVLMKKMI